MFLSLLAFCAANTLLGGVLATLLTYIRMFRMFAWFASCLGIPMVLPTVSALLALARRVHTIMMVAAVVSFVVGVALLVAWVLWSFGRSEITPSGGNLAAARHLHSSPPVDAFGEVLLEDDSGQSNAAHALEAHRLRAGKPGRSTRTFLHHWVSALRCQFPARMDRPADRAAMATWLSSKMRERGMRYAHIADCMPRIVELALQKSRAEVEAEEMAKVAALRTAGGRWWYDLKARVAGWFGLVPLETLRDNPEYPR